MSEIVIYESDRGEMEVSLEGETLWLSLRQLATLFGRDKSVVSRHLKTIFDSNELERSAVVAKNATTAADGKTYQVDYYNLDAIISVGYRVNSSQATRFRQWATRTLRQHLVQGYTLNQRRLENNARELEQALRLVRQLAANPELEAGAGRGLADIVSRYAQTFLLLQRYDEGLLAEPAVTAGGQLPTLTEARQALGRLKADLIQRGEATDLFAREHSDAFEALLGNLDQSVFGEPAYPSVEAKAAHLLYFVIKNHPFTDGNKRSAAYLFVDFLHRNQRLLDETGHAVINDIGLASLALLVAESAPEQKDTIIRLIMNMLAKS